MRCLFLLCLFFSAAAAHADAPALAVALSASPGHIYVERLPDAQALNFDLLIDNRSSVALDIDRVQLSVYDAANHLLLRRFIDGNGIRPSIETLAGRSIPAGAKLTVFNPFASLDKDLAIARLHYDVDLSNADGSQSTTRSLDVTPIAYRNADDLVLPLRGRIINYDGHDHLAHHRRFDVQFAPIAAMGFKSNFMRYSYDFVPVNASGEMFAGDFKRNADWFGFGQDIRAVADGIVVATMGTRPDDRHFDQAGVASDPMSLFGNYIVIDHGHGEFGVYGHLQQGSVQVKVGQHLHQGDAIAKIGASGSAFFPHLHFELQDGPDTRAEGLPSYFSGYSRVLGETKIPRQQATVDTGEIVEAD